MNAVAEVERVQPAALRLKALPKLTDKQAKFVDGILTGLNQSAAYREAYDCENSQPHTIWVNASKLANDTKVSMWLDWARLEAADDAKCTLDTHLVDLKRIRDDAHSEGEFGSAVSAERARGSAAGLHNKHATITHMSLETLPRTAGKLPSQVVEGVIEGGNIDNEGNDEDQ